MKIRSLVCIVTALLATQLLVRGASPGLDAFEQNQKLGRGVNILGYDPIWRSRDKARFQAGYFKLLKDAGFTSVRINLQPFSLMDGDKLPESWFATLDWALAECQKQGLQAIIDFHEYNRLGEDPAGNKAKFLAFWRQVSERYQNAPDSVLFEILNEPNKKLTPELWNEYLAEALAIIREKNPTRNVIVGPAFWNSIEHLAELRLPAADRHLIVTVHYYSPMEFTHQGAAWAGRKDKVGIEWLGDEQDRQRIKKDFDKAQNWAKENNRPIFLGEFGAYDKAPMESRVRYVNGVARAAEQRGWSWAYWQFDSDFILYDVTRGAWVEPIKTALFATNAPAASTRWTDARELTVEGKGWTNTAAFYDRLPAKAEGKAPAAVWDLSRQSAGISIRFTTDASSIAVRWVLTSPGLAMPHMAATGVSGVDLYTRTAAGAWRWLAVGKPAHQTNDMILVKNLPPGKRDYVLYLPLYNGVKSLEIGVPDNATLAPLVESKRSGLRPVVFYGTSILQGGCASRPGMVHTAILERKLGVPIVNLGFSGSGKMEPAMGELLAELDPSVYVLDCLPNMTAEMVTERVEPFVQTLRKAHPKTPIVLVEDRRYPDGFLLAGKKQANDDNHAALRAAYERLKKAGVKNLTYVPGDNLLGEDGEDTVDGSHPTDLGFARQAEVFAKALKPLLPK
jgi:aryl-phospho-beta-D-glucosidase BglC (GH1 family)